MLLNIQAKLHKNNNFLIFQKVKFNLTVPLEIASS